MSLLSLRFISKFPEIVDGWKNLVFSNDKMEALAYQRLEDCKGCDQNSTPGEVKLKSYCKSCGCVLAAKARSPESKCPLDRWQSLEQTSTQ